MPDIIAIDLDDTGYASTIREYASRGLNCTVQEAVRELLISAIEAELDRE